MKTFVFVIIMSLASMIYGADSTNTNISLRTYLETDDVPLNREVVYHVELSWEGDLQRYHITRVSEPVLSNLKLRGSGSSNRFYTDDQGNPYSLKRISYYFTPLDLGMGYIDGISVQYQNIQSQQTETLSAQRLGVKIVEAVDEPGSLMDGGTFLVLGLVLIFFIVLAYYLLKYFRIRKQQELLVEKEITLEEKYQLELKTVLKERTGDLKNDFSAIVRILKGYLKEKYDLIDIQSFDDIKAILDENGIENELADKLQKMFEQSELSKFAGESISESDFQFYTDTIEMLIEALKDKESK